MQTHQISKFKIKMNSSDVKTKMAFNFSTESEYIETRYIYVVKCTLFVQSHESMFIVKRLKFILSFFLFFSCLASL